MEDVSASPKDSITFFCRECGLRFSSRPDVTSDAPDEPHHPWSYQAYCPKCEELVPQVAWEKSLFKAWANATGPRTVDGIAKSAANLDGHPTPEEALRTRFNAMKHGATAKTAKYFPARPGKYPQCDSCELRLTVCPEEIACLKKVELFMQYDIAFDTRDPGKLMSIHGGNQAAMQAMINEMFLAIAEDGGPSIREPKWTTDEKGKTELVSFYDPATGEYRYGVEIKAHPLLKILMDFIHKNNLTMADLEMTPKAKDEQEALKGFIDQQPGAGEKEAVTEFMTGQAKQLAEIKVLIERSKEQTDKDPVLIEHQALDQNG